MVIQVHTFNRETRCEWGKISHGVGWHACLQKQTIRLNGDGIVYCTKGKLERNINVETRYLFFDLLDVTLAFVLFRFVSHQLM